MKFTLLIGAEHCPTDSMVTRLTEHVEQVRLAREVGFDSIVIGSHLSYGTAAWFPPIETLMRLSAAADGMSLGTCMLVLPLYHPVEVAEQFALLDAACGGRAVMGVSPGWTQSEFDLVGLDFSKRIGRFTEAVSLIKRLYTENEVTFEGKHFRVNNATLALKPTQKPRPPMWLGGSVEAAVKRVASIAENCCAKEAISILAWSRSAVRPVACRFVCRKSRNAFDVFVRSGPAGKTRDERI